MKRILKNCILNILSILPFAAISFAAQSALRIDKSHFPSTLTKSDREKLDVSSVGPSRSGRGFRIKFDV